MKILVMIVLSFCTSLSMAQDIATFRNNTVLIPQVRVGDEVVENVVLTPHDADTFLVSSIGSSNVSDAKSVARYFPQSGIAEIDYVTLGVSTYRGIRLKANGDELSLIEAIPLFRTETTAVSTPDRYQPTIPEQGSQLDTIAVLDLNRDGLLDIVAHFWHRQSRSVFPPNYEEPVNNNLVIYLQTENRDFRIATKEILGSEFVDLGGTSRKRVIGDFNRDGYPDIAYAMNKEDERPSGWSTNPAVLMSNGDGSYRIDILPSLSYYHSVDTRITTSGHVDIVFNGERESEPSHAYRYINDKPVSVSTYPYLDPAAFAFENSGDRTVSKRILAFITRDHFENGVAVDFMTLRLFQEVDEKWKLVDEYFFNRDKNATKFLCADCSQVEEHKVLRLNGVNRIRPAIFEICSMGPSPNNDSIFVALLSSRIVPNNLTDGVNNIGKSYEDWTQEYLAFRVRDGKLEYIPNFIDKQDDDVHSLWFSCSDNTGDGFPDIQAENNAYTSNYVEQDRGVLTLYRNNQNGLFERIDPRIFPRPTTADFPPNYARRAIYEDLNSDGIKDILYYSANTKVSGDLGNGARGWIHSPVSFYIYWGLNDMFKD